MSESNKTGNHKGTPNDKTSNPKRLPQRKSIRLKGYDYSQAGLYFVTICVQNRKCLFGRINRGQLILNDAGQMVENEWLKIPQRFNNTRLHAHIVMPNHFHAILEIARAPLVGAQIVRAPLVGAQNESSAPSENGQPQGIAPTGTGKTLGEMVGAFQSITTVEYIRGVKTQNWPPFDGKLWQRNYWEHIIRNETAYHNISQYIINNPSKWAEDKLRNTL